MGILGQSANQSQKQTFRLSQSQVQAVNFLRMSKDDLKNEIYRFADENPAVQIVNKNELKQKSENFRERSKSKTKEDSDKFQAMLENHENRGESLQSHLIHQLNMEKITPDEYALCEALIYNLDENGCYGSMRSPESLIDKNRPLQNKKMLEKCINRIQKMDPIGTCCKNPEESLLIQAKVLGNASKLTLFILDGNLEFLSPPQSEKILKKLQNYKNEWHKKAFAPEIPLNKIELNIEEVEKTLEYVLSLNPRPASEYYKDTSEADFFLPEIILKITKEKGHLSEDDFLNGKVKTEEKFYFQIKYLSGDLPELKINPEFERNFKKNSQNQNIEEERKKLLQSAREFLSGLEFRKSTAVLQGCAIVRSQIEFFKKGPGNLNVLTRKQIAEQIGVHESTVSRLSAKKGGKYFETEWGIFPASYFFTSGVKNNQNQKNQKISSDKIKVKIQEILKNHEKDSDSTLLSDSKLTKILNEQGIQIARRTVAKYRLQMNVENSYERNKKE